MMRRPIAVDLYGVPMFDPSFLVGAPQGQLNQRDFGGGVWKSNPPFDSRRAESPALKAGKVTGPLSPPFLVCDHDTEFAEGMQTAIRR